MARRQIVIVTEELDAHADDIIRELRKMGEDPTRLHPADLPISNSMSFRMENKRWAGGFRVGSNARTIDIQDIRSIWWRRPSQFTFPEDISLQEREFARGELDHVWLGLHGVVDCYWMSFPPNIRQARSKLAQLERAAQLGFDIPRTLITMDPAEARAFHEQCGGKMIYKVMSDPQLARRQYFESTGQVAPLRTTYTTLVTEKELGMLDSVRLAPCQFQELIPKKLELRVTVIGDDVFAAEIHSQDNERTSLDWRHYEVSIPYRKGTLPPEVAERCLALVRGFQLNYSALDLILTPDGRYVFIESNPNGQFMFVEQHVPELKMAAAMASCLARGSNQ